jgi:hypothetical protein
MRSIRRARAALVTLTLAITLIGPAIGAGAVGGSNQRDLARAARESTTSQTPTPPLGERADAIASQLFPDSYAGDVAHADGSVTVYVTASGMQALSDALAQQIGPATSAGYSIVQVARSFADLESLTSRIAGDNSALAQSGYDLTS